MGGELRDQIALVTGAASGIGRASARALAEAGAVVILADRDGAGVAREAAALVAAGCRVEGGTLDVGDSQAVDQLVDGVVRRHGRLDCVVHCAAVGTSGNLIEVTDEEWREVMRVNLDGSFWVGRAAGRAMAGQHHGTMVFFASDRGQLGSAQAGPYAASKGGVIALVKSLALALGGAGVTVNAVNPGPTDTPMLTEDVKRQRMAQDPLGKLSRPEDIGEIVVFLCGPARNFMTGQVVTTRMR